MAFANAVAALAEAANHHPDILIHGWNKVRLELTTHSADGLTQSDLDLARGLAVCPPLPGYHLGVAHERRRLLPK